MDFGPIGGKGQPSGRNRRKEKKNLRKSSTPGSQKHENCQASTMDRYMAKSSRSYKHPNYPEWLEKTKTF